MSTLEDDAGRATIAEDDFEQRLMVGGLAAVRMAGHQLDGLAFSLEQVRFLSTDTGEVVYAARGPKGEKVGLAFGWGAVQPRVLALHGLGNHLDVVSNLIIEEPGAEIRFSTQRLQWVRIACALQWQEDVLRLLQARNAQAGSRGAWQAGYEQPPDEARSRTSLVRGLLTDKEVEVLRWASIGKTSWETAEILGKSELTVKKQIDSAIKKLGCSGKTHAVAKAISTGVIRWDAN